MVAATTAADREHREFYGIIGRSGGSDDDDDVGGRGQGAEVQNMLWMKWDGKKEDSVSEEPFVKRSDERQQQSSRRSDARVRAPGPGRGE